MSLNDAPLARIRKSISSSSADQIAELLGASDRTISTLLPIFAILQKTPRQANYGSRHLAKPPLTGWAVVQAHAGWQC
ncbi:hypothetical protein ABIB90_008515 [Bradyrhizobium sp. JR4.1]|uniref:hypothetical protein n=1 Tax=unclassified Bradyrhizobium TaxID=2631580 RepID=UPI00025D0DCF|nr:hypothetical protein [Bradyrhizobium sp. WSM1253]EIG63657.1 hypothetical protein Bra1253DRAFT_00163 [Bradyrhizobium sp. WSM1253]